MLQKTSLMQAAKLCIYLSVLILVATFSATFSFSQSVPPSCSVGGESDCSNAIDDDNNGFTDCADICCSETVECMDPPFPGDTDFDQINDSVDNCPFVFNPEQADSDNDGIGDLCESRPVPTLSELGFVVLAFILGTVGLIVLRRKKLS